jgi:uncharacterized protein (DUF58 family)
MGTLKRALRPRALPTARGLTLAGIVVGTYVAARIVGTWELYLICLGFLGTLLLSWLMVLATARKLEADRSLVPARPTAGDELVLTFRVRNGSLLPGLQVTFGHAAGDLGAGDGEVDFESLGPRSLRVASTVPQPARRGIHHLPQLTADAADPLGLVRTRCRLGDPLDVSVYPRLVHLYSCALLADPGTRSQLGRRGPTAMGASEFRGIRPHYPGEPLNHVDWKSTAKTGSLMLREMDDPTSGDVTLLLDGTASRVAGQTPETNYELAVQAAGSVADFALRAGRHVNLLLHESHLRQSRLSPDANGRRRLLESLAAALPDAGTPLYHTLRTLGASSRRLVETQILTVVALSLDEELAHALISLRREGMQISVLLAGPRSFAPVAITDSVQGTETQGPLLSLASRGVLCLSIDRGDDLHSALSIGRTVSPYARVR